MLPLTPKTLIDIDSHFTTEKYFHGVIKYFSVDIQLALHSSPRFSTWIWLPDWRVLIDAGDGATQHMGYKIHKVDTVLLTHAHRDHIGGLLQVLNQRGEAGSFAVGNPAGGHAFEMIEDFARKFNPGTARSAVWHDLEDGDEMPSGVEGRVIETFRTRHYGHDDINLPPLSLGYRLIWRKRKLKDEYMTLDQAQLDEIRLREGKEAITRQVDERWITVGGDGQALSAEDVVGSKLLLHEATFLDAADSAGDPEAKVGHIHSTVEEALTLAKESEVPNVVLYHISTRYTDAEIKSKIREVAQRLDVQARVWATLPRRIYWRILQDRPLWGNEQ